MRYASVILMAAWLLLAGCNSATPPTATNSSATTDTDAAIAADEAPRSPDSLSTSADADTSLANPEPSTPKEIVKGPTDTNTTDANAAGSPEPQEKDEMIAGIGDANLSRSYQRIRDVVKESPDDAGAQLQLINILQNVGMTWMNQGSADKGYRAFGKSAELADQLVAKGDAVPEGAGKVLGNVFYNGACAASLDKKPEEALAALDKAFQWGFADFKLMSSDADLVAVRSLPEYADKVAAWKKIAEEKLVELAKEDLQSGDTFPFEFALTDVDGKDLNLADYRGKVVIVDVWGTWCPPCRAEIPSFIKLQSEYADRGFQMIGLNKEYGAPDAAVKTVQSFISKQGMNYPCAMLDKATEEMIPNLEGFPTTLFIDRTGKVRMVAVGLHEYAYLEAIVKLLLEEPA